MTFFRIVTGIRSHFEMRFIEWLMGFTLVWWGLRLIGENDAWSNEAAWIGLTQYLPENTWGWISIALGLARLIALAINGTFQNTIYSRFSPMVRGITSIASGAMWLLVFLSVNATQTSGGGIYHLPLVLELWCMRHAWKDTGRARHNRHGMA